MNGVYNRASKLQKLIRILAELDKEQPILDRHDVNAAEDLRWARIYLSKAMTAINESFNTLDSVRK